MENKKCTFIKIGEFEHNNIQGVVFFNEKRQTIDYFFKNESFNTVDCLSLALCNAKRVFHKVDSVEKLRENYKVLWSIICSSKKNFRLLSIQTFDMSFWEDCVLKEFEGMEIQIATKEEAEKLKEELK